MFSRGHITLNSLIACVGGPPGVTGCKTICDDLANEYLAKFPEKLRKLAIESQCVKGAGVLSRCMVLGAFVDSFIVHTGKFAIAFKGRTKKTVNRDGCT